MDGEIDEQEDNANNNNPAPPPPQQMAAKGPKLKVQPFDPYGDRLDLGKKWDKWIERFERDLKYNGIDPSLPQNSEMAKMALMM